ncbi:MAG TPA: AAA family ATPase [Myxococcus sp.]|nr:AAA family ATPase [Myxococcus sp.]
MPITELRIEGLRTIEKLRLKLDGLTVLIGENGSGKSSIIEACELLRRATSERFLDEFYSIHGGLTALLRQGASHLRLGVTVKPARGTYPQYPSDYFEELALIEYELVLLPHGSFAVLEETIRVQPKPSSLLAQHLAASSSRTGKSTVKRQWIPVVEHKGGRRKLLFENYEMELDDRTSILSRSLPEISAGTLEEAVAKAVAIHLRNLHTHLPFEVLPAWAARALDRKAALRTSAPLAPADRLEKLGLNLANAFHALKNNYSQEEWQRTLDYIRLGLGNRIEDVSTLADPSGGSIGLALKFKNLDRQVPASQLSDGMLSYLAFVALFRLRATPPSLVALDEPDLHLHPRLLMRVLDMFEAMARDFPVLVATHSDRLLDGLSDPARSVVLCELDENQATRLYRPDPRALAKWLERYRGLGDIRGAGHEASVLTRKERA